MSRNDRKARLFSRSLAHLYSLCIFQSAKGAISYQPGAKPQEAPSWRRRGLKARAIFRTFYVSGFQPLSPMRSVTWGVAPCWYDIAPLALGTTLIHSSESRSRSFAQSHPRRGQLRLSQQIGKSEHPSFLLVAAMLHWVCPCSSVFECNKTRERPCGPLSCLCCRCLHSIRRSTAVSGGDSIAVRSDQ